MSQNIKELENNLYFYKTQCEQLNIDLNVDYPHLHKDYHADYHSYSDKKKQALENFFKYKTDYEKLTKEVVKFNAEGVVVIANKKHSLTMFEVMVSSIFIILPMIFILSNVCFSELLLKERNSIFENQRIEHLEAIDKQNRDIKRDILIRTEALQLDAIRTKIHKEQTI